MGGSIMGNAGRVLMIPKGEYNSATTYEMLDFVYYQGRSYVCKQTSTGNAPTNTTYWQALTGDASAEIQALTNYVAENNVKNILNLAPFQKNTSSYGITFGDNGDGTYPATGTSTGNAQIYWIGIPASTYGSVFSNKILTGCPNIQGCSIRIEQQEAPWKNYATDTGDGAIIGEIPANAGNLTIICRVASGTTVNGAVFSPMIREASITDPTYQPYAKTNVELTQDVAVKKLTDYTPTAGTNVSIRGIDIYRSGNTISLLVYFDVTSDLANNDIVVSFDKSLPKPATLYALGMCKSLGGDIGQLQMHRNSSNQIQAWGALKTGSYYCAPITYLTTE